MCFFAFVCVFYNCFAFLFGQKDAQRNLEPDGLIVTPNCLFPSRFVKKTYFCTHQCE